MATSLPTFQNQTADPINVPRYNLSSIALPVNKYVTGAYYLEYNTVNGISTGTPIFEVLGLTDVSSGVDPVAADIIYDYPTPPTVICISGYSGVSGYSGLSAPPGGTSGQLQYNDGGLFAGVPGSEVTNTGVTLSATDGDGITSSIQTDLTGVSATATDGTNTSTFTVTPTAVTTQFTDNTNNVSILLDTEGVDISAQAAESSISIIAQPTDIPGGRGAVYLYGGRVEVDAFSNTGGQATINVVANENESPATEVNIAAYSSEGANSSRVVIEPTKITIDSLVVLIPNLANYADDTAAKAAGLVDNQLYVTGGYIRRVEPVT